MEQQSSQSRKWWRIGDAAVLAAYAGVVLWTIPYHEKWADEAQAWLIARDLDLRTMWFHELRYEGSPGLWHTILWIAQHVFHAGYGTLSYIGAAFAIAGAALLIFFAPFPRYIRWPLAFTYVMVYQYAVIARPYTLFPLLAFAAALLFADVRRPERITVILILLALLTIHGAILAGCLGLAYLLEARGDWSTFTSPVHRKYWLCVAAMACVYIFLFFILKPTPDIEEFVIKQQFAQASPEFKAQIPTAIDKMISVVSGAFIDWLAPSIVLVVLLAAWTIWRRKWLPFVLSVGALIVFYGAVHGAAHHHGTVFIAAIIGLWIAWPQQREDSTPSARDELVALAVNGLLLLLCAINVWDSAVVIQREYKYPYSGAQDAAQYLKKVGADRGPMFGLLFGVVAVQAYFDHNIFINNPTTYFHHGLPLGPTMLNVDLLYQVKPEYVVAYSMDPEVMLGSGVHELTSRGYELVHFSDGYYLYKRAVFEREVYFIFRRSPELDSSAQISAYPGAANEGRRP
jgi:MFS family permease